MTTLQKYQLATGVLTVLVIVLVFWIVTSNNQSVTDELNKARSGLTDCNTHLSAWRTENPGGATTAASQSDLTNILSQCAKSLQ